MVSILPYGFVENMASRLNHMPSFTGLFLRQETWSMPGAVPGFGDTIFSETASPALGGTHHLVGEKEVGIWSLPRW